tara:strand:+ start:13764 stop:15002 length:1239 start_codon:yes stop_codon:yes gene_type:complete
LTDQYLENYLDLIMRYGKSYLASGGSTSRLEESLWDFGQKMDIETEVFATSSGIFVTCSENGKANKITRMGRIYHGENDMAELIRLENLLEEMRASRKAMEKTRHKILEVKSFTYSRLVFFTALFLFGVATSLPSYGSWGAAIGSGLLVMLVFWMSGAFAKKLGLTGVFTEFLGCCFIFLVAGFCAVEFHVPARAFAEGALILMVPGLTITNAISELANHNFISGTSKMMRGILTLLAMGTAFLFARDVAGLVGDVNLVSPVKDLFEGSFVLKVIGMIGSASAVGILFNVPARLIPFSVITAVASWTLLQSVQGLGFYVLGSFLPALSVGFFSMAFSRIFKVPSQVFSVPGILSLVPGMLALSSFFQFSGFGEEQSSIGMRVMIIASSIVFGLFTARIPFILLAPKRQNFSE